MKTSFITDLIKGRWEGLTASTEGLSELPGATECEYVFFYKLTEPSQLFKAQEIIEQEQWQIAIPVVEGSKHKGWLRVRKERHKGDAEAQLTTTLKVAEEGVGGRKELNLGCDEPFFECFKLLCAEGMRKTRFVFPIEGTEGKGPDGGVMSWEIDVFDDPETAGAELWVKVDLEVSEPLTELPEFPLSYEKSITNQWNQRTEEEQEFIKQLFSRVYTAVQEPTAATETAPVGDDTDPQQDTGETTEPTEVPEATEEAPDETTTAA